MEIRQTLQKPKKTHGGITLEQEISLVEIPHPLKATFKSPPPRARITVKYPGYARGGMLKLQLDQYIMIMILIIGPPSDFFQVDSINI